MTYGAWMAAFFRIAWCVCHRTFIQNRGPAPEVLLARYNQLLDALELENLHHPGPMMRLVTRD